MEKYEEIHCAQFRGSLGIKHDHRKTGIFETGISFRIPPHKMHPAKQPIMRESDLT